MGIWLPVGLCSLVGHWTRSGQQFGCDSSSSTRQNSDVRGWGVAISYKSKCIDGRDIMEGNDPGKCAFPQNQVGRVFLYSLGEMRANLMMPRTGFSILPFGWTVKEVMAVEAPNRRDGRPSTSALEWGSRGSVGGSVAPIDTEEKMRRPRFFSCDNVPFFASHLALRWVR